MIDFRCGDFVAHRIHQLGGDDPSVQSPTVRGLLAQLRQAATAEPGTAPSIWSLTLDGIPADLTGVRRQRAETAIHVALTQFATHQQGRTLPMHRRDQPFGLAVRKLAAATAGERDVHETPVYSRFMAMARATNLPGLLAHSRGIITQLRSHDIPFDYTRYADDLVDFLTPGRGIQVQRRWGRDFHRLPTTPTNTVVTEGVAQ